MTMPARKLWSLSFALMVPVALLSLGANRCQPVISEGTDCWRTDPAGTEQRLQTLPAHYFGNGSKAVPRPTVRLQGVPLPPDVVAAPYPEGCGCPEQVETTVTWLDPHGNATKDMRHAVTQVVDQTTDVDTCVRRTTDARFPGQGAAVKVDIELVRLSLKSADPLAVSYMDGSTKMFDVLVTQSATQDKGSMTFTANSIQGQSAKGDVELGKLHVNYDVEFVEQGGPFTKKETGLKLVLEGTKGEFAKQ